MSEAESRQFSVCAKNLIALVWSLQRKADQDLASSQTKQPRLSFKPGKQPENRSNSPLKADASAAARDDSKSAHVDSAMDQTDDPKQDESADESAPAASPRTDTDCSAPRNPESRCRSSDRES